MFFVINGVPKYRQNCKLNIHTYAHQTFYILKFKWNEHTLFSAKGNWGSSLFLFSVLVFVDLLFFPAFALLLGVLLPRCLLVNSPLPVHMFIVFEIV